MDELDELIEEFEWRASMEGELAKSAFVKESRDAKRNTRHHWKILRKHSGILTKL